MMPSVAACIVRRGVKLAIGFAFAPIGLAFEIGSVAGGAVLAIERRTLGHELCIQWVCATGRLIDKTRIESEADADGKGDDENDPVSFHARGSRNYISTWLSIAQLFEKSPSQRQLAYAAMPTGFL